MPNRPLDAMGRPAMSLTEMLRGGHGWRPAPPSPPPAPPRAHQPVRPKARPTVYAGIEFRSRLEARWACFFDELGVVWTYEPFDGNGYSPDLLLPHLTERPALAEIKPAVTEAEYRAAIPKMTAGLAGHWTGHLLILGADPLPAWNVDELRPWVPGRRPGMLLGIPDHNGGWFRFLAVPWPSRIGETTKLRAAWAAACNTTKWRPPR
jgi:hypothetical protein